MRIVVENTTLSHKLSLSLFIIRQYHMKQAYTFISPRDINYSKNNERCIQFALNRNYENLFKFKSVFHLLVIMLLILVDAMVIFMLPSDNVIDVCSK